MKVTTSAIARIVTRRAQKEIEQRYRKTETAVIYRMLEMRRKIS